MKKFMAVYLATRAEIDKFMSQDPETRQKAAKADMEVWSKWMEEHASDLADGGTMFGKNVHIDASGSKDQKNEMTGYSIVKADSYDAAVKLFEGHPYLKFPGSSIELMECIDMN